MLRINKDKLAAAIVDQLTQLGIAEDDTPKAAPAPAKPTPGTRESVDALTKQLASEVQTLLANRGINPNKDNTVLLVVDAR